MSENYLLVVNNLFERVLVRKNVNVTVNVNSGTMSIRIQQRRIKLINGFLKGVLKIE